MSRVGRVQVPADVDQEGEYIRDGLVHSGDLVASMYRRCVHFTTWLDRWVPPFPPDGKVNKALHDSLSDRQRLHCDRHPPRGRFIDDTLDPDNAAVIAINGLIEFVCLCRLMFNAHTGVHDRGVYVGTTVEVLQRVRAIAQALEALVYLHTLTPQVLHRDFKPANILLNASLHACLGDTGFAKAAQRSDEASQLRGSTTGRVMGSPGYAHKDVMSGQYSETTEVFAVGVTLLVALTNRDPVDIEEEIEGDHDERPFNEIPGISLAEAGLGWPAAVADEVKALYTGLCIARKRNQLKLPAVLASLHSLLQNAPGGSEASKANAAPPTAAEDTRTQLDASAVEQSPLSLQVRGMRRANGSEQSMQVNVSVAFGSMIRRLDALYHSAQAPADFVDRIDYWRTACSLPSDVHQKLHTLRIWRNASLHHDEQRWAHEGPRGAEAASRLIAELDARICELEKRA
jgi:hypothetical protein